MGAVFFSVYRKLQVLEAADIHILDAEMDAYLKVYP